MSRGEECAHLDTAIVKGPASRDTSEQSLENLYSGIDMPYRFRYTDFLPSPRDEPPRRAPATIASGDPRVSRVSLDD
jgi:hypothetical protein